jgi:hypothetical protein
MASVREVYNALKDIANKDQRGFVTPTEFNSFAPIAQANVFNAIFKRLMTANAMRKRGIDGGRDKSETKQLKEDMSMFSKTSNAITRTLNAHFEKPDDLAKIISVKTDGSLLLGTNTSVTVPVEYDEEKIEYILNSNLSAPTETSPVAFLDDEIEVYPQSIKKIRVRYYKQPEGINPTTGARTASMPKFGFTTNNNKETYDASTSVDFELPEHYTPEIIEEMARLIGVNLRDTNIYTYAESQSQKR